MNLIVLVIVVFFYHESPKVVALPMMTTVAKCQEDARDFKKIAEEDETIQDVEFSCVEVHEGNKS